jgi:hypothetical protein
MLVSDICLNSLLIYIFFFMLGNVSNDPVSQPNASRTSNVRTSFADSCGILNCNDIM